MSCFRIDRNPALTGRGYDGHPIAPSRKGGDSLKREGCPRDTNSAVRMLTHGGSTQQPNYDCKGADQRRHLAAKRIAVTGK